ncbi:MAG: NAD-dependent epimerase/dehydratase family protein [Chloroflexi bacterium]|nr:NAD-dependent epimerase/dehydratase family protein [Chloroflexota bacterium]
MPVSLRFATAYGAAPRPRFDLTVNEFTRELTLGRRLEVYGEQFWRPYTHVYDLARAVVLALEAPAEKVAYDVFNVGDTRENYQKKTLVELIQQIVPVQGDVVYVHKDEDPRDYRVSFEKIRRVLGYHVTRRVPDGIREIYELIRTGFLSNPDDPRYRNVPV